MVKSSNDGNRKILASSASVVRWNSADDLPLDQQEQFHHERDEVLLNGDAEKDEAMDYGKS